MPENNTPNLGKVVTNPTARKIVYGIYAVGAVVVGGTAAYFLGIGWEIPAPVVGAQAVVAYLGIPVGALAVLNTPSGGDS